MTDVSVRFSVVVRDKEVYLCKDVINHFINVFGRHGLGIFHSFDDIRAKSLDASGKRVL